MSRFQYHNHKSQGCADCQSDEGIAARREDDMALAEGIAEMAREAAEMRDWLEDEAATEIAFAPKPASRPERVLAQVLGYYDSLVGRNGPSAAYAETMSSLRRTIAVATHK